MRLTFSRFCAVLAVVVEATLVVPADAWAVPPDHERTTPYDPTKPSGARGY
ncbi:MAG: hypothetical protein QOE61_5824 [Micromonosporaceae bacterium]|jgi:hypothetical protein|nr:hypothetical protein [Micromonosporaceae bacterium]